MASINQRWSLVISPVISQPLPLELQQQRFSQRARAVVTEDNNNCSNADAGHRCSLLLHTAPLHLHPQHHHPCIQQHPASIQVQRSVRCSELSMCRCCRWWRASHVHMPPIMPCTGKPLTDQPANQLLIELTSINPRRPVLKSLKWWRTRLTRLRRMKCHQA